MIKNVIFDIGAVLIKFDWDAYVGRLFEDKTARIVTAATWENPVWREFDRAVWSFDEVLNAFIEKAPEYENEIREALRRIGECTEKQPYAIPWVDSLKAEGYKVFFLSNYFEYLVKANSDVLDFIPRMDGGVFSFEIHETKPSAAIYGYICEKYSLVPDECLFIDDSRANVDGAVSFGMNAIQFESYESTYPVIAGFLRKNGAV